MDPLVAKLHSESNANTALAKGYLENASFTSDPKIQAAYLVSQNAANMLQIAATVVEYLAGMQNVSDAQLQRNAIRERFNAIRTAELKAIESGDWTAFDRLANGVEGDSGGG